MDADEAQQIVDIMADADLPLYVGFCYRFSGCAQTIRDLVQDGAIGQVRSLRLIYNWDCHGKYEQDAEIQTAHRWNVDANSFCGITASQTANGIETKNAAKTSNTSPSP